MKIPQFFNYSWGPLFCAIFGSYKIKGPNGVKILENFYISFGPCIFFSNICKIFNLFKRVSSFEKN